MASYSTSFLCGYMVQVPKKVFEHCNSVLTINLSFHIKCITNFCAPHETLISNVCKSNVPMCINFESTSTPSNNLIFFPRFIKKDKKFQLKFPRLLYFSELQTWKMNKKFCLHKFSLQHFVWSMINWTMCSYFQHYFDICELVRYSNCFCLDDMYVCQALTNVIQKASKCTPLCSRLIEPVTYVIALFLI